MRFLTIARNIMVREDLLVKNAQAFHTYSSEQDFRCPPWPNEVQGYRGTENQAYISHLLKR